MSRRSMIRTFERAGMGTKGDVERALAWATQRHVVERGPSGAYHITPTGKEWLS